MAGTPEGQNRPSGEDFSAPLAEQRPIINPQDLTIDHVRSFLNAEKLEAKGGSSSVYGSGETIDLGRRVEGGDVVSITLYDSVYNLKERQFIRKTAPSVVVEGGEWQYTGMYGGIFSTEADYAVVVDRVEDVEALEDGVRFTGTSGKKEASLELHADGQVNFVTRPSERANEIPDVRAEVKRLEGEELTMEELNQVLQEAVKEYRLLRRQGRQ